MPRTGNFSDRCNASGADIPSRQRGVIGPGKSGTTIGQSVEILNVSGLLSIVTQLRQRLGSTVRKMLEIPYKRRPKRRAECGKRSAGLVSLF